MINPQGQCDCEISDNEMSGEHLSRNSTTPHVCNVDYNPVKNSELSTQNNAIDELCEPHSGKEIC